MSTMVCDNPRCAHHIPHTQHPDAMRVRVLNVPTFLRIDVRKPLTLKAEHQVVDRIQHYTVMRKAVYLCTACDAAVQLIMRGNVL